jgi:hypothetical protein
MDFVSGKKKLHTSLELLRLPLAAVSHILLQSTNNSVHTNVVTCPPKTRMSRCRYTETEIVKSTLVTYHTKHAMEPQHKKQCAIPDMQLNAEEFRFVRLPH